MTNAATEFFSELGRRGHEPMLQRITATMRFDLVQGQRTDHYFVAIRKGDVIVSDENAEADCVVRADRTLFDGIASGKENAMAAALRGALTFQGDAQLLVSFQRLFPGPPGSRNETGNAGSGRRRS
jgi:putative sterol carrier protein